MLSKWPVIAYPLVAQALAGFVLVVAGVFAWGAAKAAFAADWIPTFSGVFIGSFIAVGAVVSLRRLRARTRVPYRIRTPKVYVGIVSSLLLAGFAVLGATKIGDSDQNRNRSTEVKSVTFRGQTYYSSEKNSSLEPRLFVLGTIIICFPGPVSWLVYGGYRYLAEAVDPISSEVEGIDPMGQIMGKNETG